MTLGRPKIPKMTLLVELEYPISAKMADDMDKAARADQRYFREDPARVLKYMAKHRHKITVVPKD